MKRSLIGAVLLTLCLAVQPFLPAVAQPQYTVTQLTNSAAAKYITDSAGNRFVWSDSSGVISLYDGSSVRPAIAPVAPAPAGYFNRVENSVMDAENVYYILMEWNAANTLYRFNIYRYEIASALTTQVTFDTEFNPLISKGNLMISEGRVAWVKGAMVNGAYQKTLQMYDIATGGIEDIPLGAATSTVVLSGSHIVFTGGDGCGSFALIRKDLTTGQETPLATNTCPADIAISGQYVSWVDRNLGNNTYVMKLHDGTSTTELESGPFLGRSEMAGNQLVWQTCQNECEVKVHDIASNTTEAISNADYASTNGIIVMWRELKMVNNTPTFVPKYKDFSTGTVAYLNTEGFVSNESLQKYVIGEEFFAWLGSKSTSDRDQIVIATPATAPQDTTPPVVTGTPTTQPNSNGWYNGNVTINWTATDPSPSSGAPSQPGPTQATLEGTHTYISAPSCDPAGNCATGNLTLKIDKSLPTTTNVAMSRLITFTIPFLNMTISFFPPNVQSTTITATVADTVSSVASAEYYFDNGPHVAMSVANGTASANASIASLAPGQHTLQVRSQDAAGNWSLVVNKVFVK
jgi:hypothetical protein